MTTIKTPRLVRVGQAKRLTKGGLGLYLELLAKADAVSDSGAL